MVTKQENEIIKTKQELCQDGLYFKKINKCPTLQSKNNHYAKFRIVYKLWFFLFFLNVLRPDLFYLLDYVTWAEIFQIGDREKIKNRWSKI